MSTPHGLDLRLDGSSATPPYEQLRTQVARQAADGVLPAGTRLPTVRSTRPAGDDRQVVTAAEALATVSRRLGLTLAEAQRAVEDAWR